MRARPLQRLVSGGLFGVVGALTLLDMAFGPIVRPVGAWLSRSSPVEAFRTLARRLPAYPALVFLIVPIAVAEPAKVYALYLIGEGKVLRGLVLLVGAYLASFLLIDTIYDGARPQLRSIGWFAAAVDRITAVRLRVFEAVRATRAWKRARKLVQDVRARVRRLRRRGGD